MYPRYSRLLVALSVGLLFLAMCTPHRGGAIKETPRATPTPPPELLALPANARIHCDDNPDYRSAVTLWELPGTEPVDPDSSSGGNVGKALGYVKDCSVVEITDYTWSEAEQEFYIYVEADPDQEYFDLERDRLEGWLKLSFVHFLP